MTSFRITILALALPLLVGCGATTPEGYPMVKGTYGGSQMYQTHVTDLASGSESTGAVCSGTVVVTDQQDQSLSGTWLRGGQLCVVNSGSFGGTIDKTGAVRLDFQNALGFQSFDACTYVSGDAAWTGTIANDTLTMRIDVVLDCGSERAHIVQTVTAPRTTVAVQSR